MLILGKEKAKLRYLMIAGIFLLFSMLGTRELWTQEHRWTEIVMGMIDRHDYLHPFFDGNEYYDKPLLSYWLMIAMSYITGKLNLWAIRLPSALAGLLAIFSIYRIGVILKDKPLGLLAGWLLLTTYYFIFWARVGNADMLNLAGALFAVYWYFEKRNEPTLINYIIFFIILVLTALCKGLGGPAVALLAILPDLFLQQSWGKHLNRRIFIALIPALLLYGLPFWASVHFGREGYTQNGFYQVYHENIIRYFKPFDHQDPMYAYFIYLPIYLLPWTFFFIAAFIESIFQWKNISVLRRWSLWVCLLLFLFFTFSGSRRNYYILPMVPFAILLTADWISLKYTKWIEKVALLFFVVFFLLFCIVQPLFYLHTGLKAFATLLKEETKTSRPWAEWNIVMLDPDAKIRYYLGISPLAKDYDTIGSREIQTTTTLLQSWPMLKNPSDNTIYVTRKLYIPLLKEILVDYKVVAAQSSWIEKILRSSEVNEPAAFVPNKKF